MTSGPLWNGWQLGGDWSSPAITVTPPATSFPLITDKDQIDYMKKLFKSGRTATRDNEDGAWVPPIDLRLTTSHGTHRYVLGRRKWKSSGGYPTLHHGGLSLLEVFVPCIELSK